jgi:hypothetical protein
MAKARKMVGSVTRNIPAGVFEGDEANGAAGGDTRRSPPGSAFASLNAKTAI